MALSKVSAPGADPASPSATKLQNFATALGVLNTVAGLGSSAYGSLSTKPGTTSQALQKGFTLEGTPGAMPAPSAANIKTYQDPTFNPQSFSGNEFRASEVPGLGHGLSLGGQSLQQGVDPALLQRLQNPLFAAGTSGFTKIQIPTTPNYEHIPYPGGLSLYPGASPTPGMGGTIVRQTR